MEEVFLFLLVIDERSGGSGILLHICNAPLHCFW